VITQQLIQTVRTLEAEWRQVLWGSVSMRTKEDELSTGCIWAAEFHHVTACSCLAGVLKLMNHLFLSNSPIFWGPRMTETAATESVDTGAQLYTRTHTHMHR
jgi:hypothetical protein